MTGQHYHPTDVRYRNYGGGGALQNILEDDARYPQYGGQLMDILNPLAMEGAKSNGKGQYQ